MTPRQRFMAAMTGAPVDKTPYFAWYQQLRRGAFEREMRDRGMALSYNVDVLRSRTSGIEQFTRWVDGNEERVIKTPVGTVSEVRIRPRGRISNDDMWLQQTPLVKSAEDFAALVYIADHTDYAPDPDEYLWTLDDLGEDGVLRINARNDPDIEAKEKMGLVNWSLFQYDAPEEMAALIDALGRENLRACEAINGAALPPDCLIDVTTFDDSINPKRYRTTSQPWVAKAVKILHAKGMLCGVHAHGAQLKDYAPIVCELGLDYVESYTPPPYSDLPLREARQIWGDSVTIQINFPETIFFGGYQGTFEYTLDLLRQDPCPRKMIGYSEMGMTGVMPETRNLFETGFRAVLDAIDEFYR